MITLTHTVTSPSGMHARPAGKLAQIARRSRSGTLTLGEQTVELAKLFAVLSLNIGRGDEITITVEGTDEAALEAEIREILESEL